MKGERAERTGAAGQGGRKPGQEGMLVGLQASNTFGVA